MNRARDRICPDGETVVFKVDDFYEFCKQIWNASYNHRDVTIEELAEPLVVKTR